MQALMINNSKPCTSRSTQKVGLRESQRRRGNRTRIAPAIFLLRPRRENVYTENRFFRDGTTVLQAR